MTWIDILWIMMAAASLTLALIHLFVWTQQRRQREHLLFFFLAISAAVFGAFELAMMHAETPSEYQALLRWAHVPLSVFVLAIVGFVHFYLDAGRMWLAYAVCGVRLLALFLNFSTGANVNFSEVTAIDPVTLWGGAVMSAPVGTASPWAVVPQIGNVLLLAFVLDASISLWRRGDAAQRRRALLVGGSLVFCVAAATSAAGLVVSGIVHTSTMVMPGAFAIVVAMGFELGWDLIIAAKLANQLQESEASFGAVVEAAPTAILLVDRQGRIALTNAQVSAVFGYKREELAGRSVDELVPDRYREAHAHHRFHFAESPSTRAMGAGRELFARRQDGSEVPVEVSLSPMKTPRGSFVLASIVDVSVRRASEQAAARQRNELAHLSRVSMLGALSGSLAHELNQPLTAILSNAQAAQRFLAHTPPRLDQVNDIIADIVKNDKRAALVIQRLRSLLKRDVSEHVPLEVNETVQDALRLMQSDLVSRGVDVVTDFGANLPLVSADRVQLQQVILNFVVNGCEAMEGLESRPLLAVRTQLVETGNVEVTVSDRGPGFSSDRLDDAFEPFVTTKPHGMGLGLAICRTIVESHGGRIWATNNADRGATLHFALPGHGEGDAGKGDGTDRLHR